MDQFRRENGRETLNETTAETTQAKIVSLEKPGGPLQRPHGNSQGNPSNKPGLGGFVFARLGDRLIALALDTALLLSFLALIGIYLASKWGGITEHGFSLEGTPALISLAAIVVVGFAYHWLLEGLAGATLGKLVMGLRVMGPSGKVCGLKASLLRNLLRVVDGLGLYLVGLLVAVFSKSRQRLGDHLGKTVVVEYPTSGAIKAVAVLLWIFGVGSGIWFAYDMHRQAVLSGVDLSASRESSAKSEKKGADAQSVQLQAASLAQRPQELSVVNLELFEEKGKPMQPDAYFEPGKKLYAKFQIVGFSLDSKGAANLSLDVVALDPQGLALHENWKPQFQGSPGSAADPIPANMELEIPVFAPSGRYKLVIKVKDELQGSETQLVKEFPVRAAQASIPKGLEIRDFAFLASEDGQPLAKAQVQAGNRLYMVFNVAGLVFRDDSPALSVDMQLLDPDGDLVLDQPGMVELKDRVVYHPPTFFARITSWVDFPDETPKGTYTARFAVKDENAGQSLTHEAKFEVK